MLIHHDSRFSIYFGSVAQGSVNHRLPQHERGYDKLAAQCGLEQVVVSKQVHGIAGVCINQPLVDDEWFSLSITEGDWLATNQLGLGIGVLTADCLPVVMYDPVNHVVSAVHAGWKGTIAEVALVALKKMEEQWGTVASDLLVFFGPSAHTCCYEVTTDFLPNLAHFSFKDELIVERDNKLFFDVQLCNMKQLLQAGVCLNNISSEYTICTMCDDQFHSHRRDKEAALRQATIVALR